MYSEVFNNYEKLYLIFRVYSKKEQPKLEYRSKFWGWTIDKNILKAFLSQRDKKKYKVITQITEEATEEFKRMVDNNGYLDRDHMLDIIKLRSAANGKIMNIFSTSGELYQYEIGIQKRMKELSSLSAINGIKGSGINILELFVNLNDEYADALYRIGYRPPDIDILGDNAFYGAGELDDDIEEQIGDAYCGYNESPSELAEGFHKQPPGLANLEDPAHMILYSVESFIMILKEDL